MKKRVPVEELRIGMYVSELDRPWLDTKFAFQGFPITSEADLARLRQTCKMVTIDVEKSASPGSSRPGLAGLAGRQSEPYPEKVSVERELEPAGAIFEDCRQALENNLKTLLAGGELDAESVKSSVQKIAASIERNPDAMLLLTKAREKDRRQLERMLDVSVLMMTFGRFLQLPREQLDLLGMVGLLQDIGKVKVPDAVLRKQDALTHEELQQARLHVVHSAAMLRDAKGLPPGISDLVLLHHERYDGSGYPRGLAGADIGMLGCIAAIVDSYSAMTGARPYAEQMSPSNALGVLYKGRGTLYHEALVEQFIQCIGIYPVGSVVQLNSGEVAVVIAQNRVRRLQPRIMVMLDAESKPISPHRILDLIKEPKAPSGEPYRIRRTLEAAKLPIDPRDFFL
ncbi:MAG TPA: HD domain-containing phosphohydrolase [Kofleriaceae bacterium]|nr:HD domain-containing phosphohydrolase [Kofleriaceae bacterium]